MQEFVIELDDTSGLDLANLDNQKELILEIVRNHIDLPNDAAIEGISLVNNEATCIRIRVKIDGRYVWIVIGC